MVAVERSTSSVADARVNLADLDGPHRAVRVVEPNGRWRPSPADLVVADPARAGLGRRAVEVLAATGAAVVVLVSCDAASLGRDAALLAGAGLPLEQAELVDLFPHSHHVEVVARFARVTVASTAGPGAGRIHDRTPAPNTSATMAARTRCTTSPTPCSSSASAATRSRRWPRPTAATPGAVYGLARRLLANTGHGRGDRAGGLPAALEPARPVRSRARGSLRSYLLAQCHGRSVDLLRSETSRRSREERDARRTAEAGYDLEHEVLDLTVADRVRSAPWPELADGERRAIELAYLGGHTYREVAARAGRAGGHGEEPDPVAA